MDILGIKVYSGMFILVGFVLWVSVLLIIKKIIFRAVKKFAQKTKTHLDDIFIKAADFPLTILIYTSAGVVLERVLVTSPGNNYLLSIFKASIVIAFVIFIDRFLRELIAEYTHRVEILKTSGSVLQGFTRIVIIGLGALVLLDTFGVSITPIIASLGIGSLAVALALQPTLENFFAGIQIVIDKPIQLGHFVKLESGEEGYVHKIGWRSTWVKMLANNVVVIPNKVLINSKITNYYYPTVDLAVLVEVGVHYSSDLEHVEKVTVEVAKETLKNTPGAIRDFEPFIRYHTFGDFNIGFTVILRANEFTDNYLLKHEFIKRLHKRYAQEGIVIPYPIQAINYEQEKTIFKEGDK